MVVPSSVNMEKLNVESVELFEMFVVINKVLDVSYEVVCTC